MSRALAAAMVLGAAVGCSRHDASAPLHFTDVTAVSGIAFTTTSGRTPSTQVLEVKGGGAALFDLENDGDLDLFVSNGATIENPDEGPGCRLFRNDGGLRFTDVTAAAGVALTRWAFGVTAGDADGDGFDDLFVCCYGKNVLLRNLGDGRLEGVTDEAGLGDDRSWSTAACFGDVDGDGDLDLYVANFVAFDPRDPPPRTVFFGADVFAGPLDLQAQPDLLYLNDGGGTFREATAERGCAVDAVGYGLGVVILDFDDDGDQDVYVGNDSSANFLFANGGRPGGVPRAPGTFEEIGVRSGIAYDADGAAQATMGIAVGDVDGNGLPDLFTSNFMNDTNTLHVNLGGLLFEDRTQAYGLGLVSRPFLGWASWFGDFDLDGDEDLVVFDGHVYPEETTGPHGWNHDQVPLLFERRGERFERVAAEQGGAWLDDAHCDRSAVFGDLDGDGDVDAVVTGLNEPVRVLRNDAPARPWLIVELRDGRPDARNPRGIGARVELSAGDGVQRRWIHGGAGFQSCSAMAAHFGIGNAGPLRVTVLWPDGFEQALDEVAPDQRLVVRRN